jgi:hypothetical protein
LGDGCTGSSAAVDLLMANIKELDAFIAQPVTRDAINDIANVNFMHSTVHICYSVD